MHARGYLYAMVNVRIKAPQKMTLWNIDFNMKAQTVPRTRTYGNWN